MSTHDTTTAHRRTGAATRERDHNGLVNAQPSAGGVGQRDGELERDGSPPPWYRVIYSKIKYESTVRLYCNLYAFCNWMRSVVSVGGAFTYALTRSLSIDCEETPRSCLRLRSLQRTCKDCEDCVRSWLLVLR